MARGGDTDAILTDFERRLQDLELLSSQAQIANRSGSNRNTRAGTIPPRIGGLTAVPNVKTITWKWNAAHTDDLDYYIVEVANNASMAGFSSYKVNDTLFTYQEGDSATAYYARVKAHTSSNKTGPASVVVTNTTGKVVSGDITNSTIGLTHLVTGEVLNYVVLTTSPAYAVTGALAAVTGCQITVVYTSARQVAEFLIIFGGTSALTGAPTSAQNIINLVVEYGAGSSPSSWTTLVSMDPVHIPTGGVGVGGGPPTTPHAPGVGTFTYRVTMSYTNKSNAGDSMTIDTCFMRAFRYGI